MLRCLCWLIMSPLQLAGSTAASCLQEREGSDVPLAGRPTLAHPQAPLLTLQKNGFLQWVAGWQQEGQQQTCAATDCCPVPNGEWSSWSQPQGTLDSAQK